MNLLRQSKVKEIANKSGYKYNLALYQSMNETMTSKLEELLTTSKETQDKWGKPQKYRFYTGKTITALKEAEQEIIRLKTHEQIKNLVELAADRMKKSVENYGPEYGTK